MKTLAKVELTNFRTHEHTVLDLGQLTSIIGENDCGKSNVFRGIDMVLTNAPFTEGALRYGTKEGAVRVTFHDGTWLERRRKGAKQQATIFDGKTTKEFSTIKDIGAMVEEFTGFAPIVLDKNAKPESVQLIPIDAGQSFMVSGISPEVMQRRIQRLMHGAGIETAKIQLEKELRQLKATADQDQKTLTQCENLVTILERREWDDSARDIDAVYGYLKLLDDLGAGVEAMEDLRELIPTYEYCQQMKHQLAVVTDDSADVERLIAKLEELTAVDVPGVLLNIQKCMASLNDCTTELEEIDDERATLQAYIEELEEKEKQAAIAEAVEAARKEAQEVPVVPAVVAPVDPTMTLVPTDLVLDTTDCLDAFVEGNGNTALAAEISGDWKQYVENSNAN